MTPGLLSLIDLSLDSPSAKRLLFCLTVWSTTSWRMLERRAWVSVWETAKKWRLWGEKTQLASLQPSPYPVHLFFFFLFSSFSFGKAFNQIWNSYLVSCTTLLYFSRWSSHLFTGCGTSVFLWGCLRDLSSRTAGSFVIRAIMKLLLLWAFYHAHHAYMFTLHCTFSWSVYAWEAGTKREREIASKRKHTG